MRRLRAPHEQVLPDSYVISHWKFDEGSAIGDIYNTANTSTFKLAPVALAAGSGLLKAVSPFSQELNGALRVSNAWLAPTAPTLIAASLRTEWSMSAHLGDLSSSAATLAIAEYAARETIDANTLNLFGAYLTTANQTLQIRWDISTTTQQIIDTPVTLPGCIQFVHRAVDGSTTRGTFEVWKDGRLAYSVASTWFPTQTSLTSNWILGGSRRYGSNTGTTPAFVSGQASGRGIRYDDLAVFSTALSPAKCLSIYADQVRPWDEAAMVRGTGYRVEHRVLLQNGDGSGDWIDMRTLRDQDWTHEARVTDSAEASFKKATILLKRRFGRHLDLSRLNSGAELTFVGGYPLFDLRSRVRVDRAVVPLDWQMQGWEWVPRFDGFVESLDWSDDFLEIQANDLGCALDDVYRVDAKRYEYGIDSTTLARTHLQTLISDNVPRTQGFSGSAPITWGYLGGTPQVYSPETPDWLLRYEHGGTGSVLKLLQGVGDQIGWEVKYRPYEPLENERLTFFDTPRSLSLTITDIREDANGFSVVTFNRPHGLQVGQLVTITDTTNFNATDARVDEVMTYDRIRTNHQPAGTPAAEVAGTATYKAHLEIPEDAIESIGQVSSNVTDIRNHIVVRYDRKDSAATLPITYMEEDGGSVFVYFDDSADVSMIEAGADATIVSAGTTFEGTRAVVDVTSIGGNGLELTPIGSASGSATTGIFSSEYLSFSTFKATNTPSIQRYGLRTAGLFEGSTEGIDTKREAKLLADAVLADLSNPTVDLDMTVQCMPWIEVHDLLRLPTDRKGRWVGMNVAVVGYTDTYGVNSRTSLELRHDQPTRGRMWLTRNRGMLIDVGGWSPGNNFPPPTAEDLDFDFDIDTRIGTQFMASWNRRQGKKSWLHDRTEIHVSTSSRGFLPRDTATAGAASTLLDAVRGTKASLSRNTGAAADLTPGTNYFVKLRHRDKWGNMTSTQSGATAGYTMRFLTKPAAAFAYYGSATSVSFHGNAWSAFPLNNKTGSPAFDNYSNLSMQTLTGSAAYIHTASTAWVMPCNGTLQIEARLGFEYRTNGGKTTDSIGIGLFLLNSMVPGSSLSVPFAFPVLSSASPYACENVIDFPGGAGKAIRLGTGTSDVLGGSLAWAGSNINNMTAIWVTFCHQISCYSGDRVMVGVRPGTTTTHCFSAAGDNTFNASNPWIKYTLVSQD
jgi:hypothetical protein